VKTRANENKTKTKTKQNESNKNPATVVMPVVGGLFFSVLGLRIVGTKPGGGGLAREPQDEPQKGRHRVPHVVRGVHRLKWCHCVMSA